MILSLYLRAMAYKESSLNKIWTRPLLLKRVKLKITLKQETTRNRRWTFFTPWEMLGSFHEKRRTTPKTGNLGNSSFLPKTTETCYKNVSNVSQAAQVWYKESELPGIEEIYILIGAQAAHFLCRRNHVHQ